ncbi:hypothetical protein DICVIV_08176 [Dictyocaulus viviparus]|uniref:DUF4605 domain-containing protein n=1 Tax=Dictyocaulus viviparus TaxID=29172 RepID=A0A0D8XMN3_DICVI|nr:hypothetical protein DICVIV_08176 [Dictyocaulus viviparus]
MVQVLSNGEVVDDDDPRVPSSANRASSLGNQTQHSLNQITARNDLASIWNSGNHRLQQMGLQSFEISGFRIDPLHLVIAVVGFLLSGPMMLAIVIAAILISQSRSDNALPVPRTRVDNNGLRRNVTQSINSQESVKPKEFGPFSGTGKRLGN